MIDELKALFYLGRTSKVRRKGSFMEKQESSIMRTTVMRGSVMKEQRFLVSRVSTHAQEATSAALLQHTSLG